jgi:hypothetical protein
MVRDYEHIGAGLGLLSERACTASGVVMRPDAWRALKRVLRKVRAKRRARARMRARGFVAHGRRGKR